jgi:hypothetical protein
MALPSTFRRVYLKQPKFFAFFLPIFLFFNSKFFFLYYHVPTTTVYLFYYYSKEKIVASFKIGLFIVCNLIELNPSHRITRCSYLLFTRPWALLSLHKAPPGECHPNPCGHLRRLQSFVQGSPTSHRYQM